jgi:hypothetical protein
MRLHPTAMRRSMIALPGVALVLTSLAVLVMGGEPPRADHRDREVLEAALKDILNPKNPIYARDEHFFRPPPRTIVLERLAGGAGDAEVFEDQKMISKELVTSWEQRNSGGTIPLKTLGLQGKELIVIDVDELDEEARKRNQSFWGLFWERYPDSWGCARVSLPGYSRGGTAAVVELHISRAEYHPDVWIILLTQVEGRWNVGWRHRETW